MKKTNVLLLCSLLTLSLGTLNGCGSKSTDSAISAEDTSGQTQISNPFTDCDTLEEAKKLAGFSISVPASIDGYTRDAITAIPDEIIHVSFRNGDDEIYFRKGTLTDDLSGDYNVYAYEDTLMEYIRTLADLL